MKKLFVIMITIVEVLVDGKRVAAELNDQMC